MTESRWLNRLLMTWAVLIPVLLIITFVLSPGVLVSVFAAAIVSPILHSLTNRVYGKGRTRGLDFKSRLTDL